MDGFQILVSIQGFFTDIPKANYQVTAKCLDNSLINIFVSFSPSTSTINFLLMFCTKPLSKEQQYYPL